MAESDPHDPAAGLDDDRLSDAEIMMHRIEADPRLDPSGGSLVLYDRPLDMERFRRCVASAVAAAPRLRQRLVDGPGPVTPPHWAFDPDFDLDHHLRRVGAPGSGSLAELVGWVTHELSDPLDPHRPLWRYVVVDGVDGDRSALVARIHHTVADGATAVRLAEAYTQPAPDHPDPDPVDLDAVHAADLARGDQHVSPTGRMGDAVALPLGLVRRAAGLVTHPRRLARAGTEAVDLARTVAEQLRPAGSQAWQARSGRRHCEILSVDFAELRSAAHALGGTVNDAFLTALVEGSRRHHLDIGEDLDHLHVTFVVSTRGPDSGANAFTPVPVDLPAGPLTLSERFAAVHEAVATRRGEIHGAGPMAALAQVSHLVPTPVMTAVVRDQARHIDVATSNLPGLLGTWYNAGALVEHSWAFGPVAGTAMNVTAVSTHRSLDLGLHVDPVAIVDPAGLRDHLTAAFADLLTTT